MLVAHIMNVLNATELCTSKRIILYYMNFTSSEKNSQMCKVGPVMGRSLAEVGFREVPREAST